MSQALSILVPITVVDSMLVSSTASETDYPEWAAGTTYAVDGMVISSTTHRIYKSLRAGNVAHSPTDIINLEGDTPWWVDSAPTNKWAMFDGEVNTQTSVASPLTVVMRPGPLNSIYIGGIDAEEVSVSVKDATGGTVVFTLAVSLEGSMPDDYYEYFFSPFRPQRDIIITGIPPYATAEVTITLTKTSGTVKCGIVALGDLTPLGMSQYGAKASPKTYSYIKTDSFGKTTIVRRHSAKDISASAWLKLEEANSVIEALTNVLDIPCVLIVAGDSKYSGLRGFGLINGDVSYDHPNDCLLSITQQGVI